MGQKVPQYQPKGVVKPDLSTEYKKYEFCKAIKCMDYSYDYRDLSQKNKTCLAYDCKYSAKRFHNWLQENGFIIIKREN